MSRRLHTATFTALSILLIGVSASAETLRCQSVNGNLNCAGSGGVSCQTVDGKKVCVSGHGDVVQSFGNEKPDAGTDQGSDDESSDPSTEQRTEPRQSHGRTFILQRDGTSLHLRTDRLSIDRD
jgi:hypothetical protein